jgi:hypothetical protein
MSKYNPKNKEVAFSYQFEDTVNALKLFASLDQTVAFKQTLQTLKSHIKAYEKSKK